MQLPRSENLAMFTFPLTVVCFGVAGIMRWFTPFSFLVSVSLGLVVQRYIASGYVTLNLIPKPLYHSLEAHKPLKNQVAVVTGCNSGCGYWTCVQLLRLGAHVVGTTRRANTNGHDTEEELLQEAELTRETGDINVLELELGFPESIKKFVQSFHSLNLGRLDVLVNNAGALFPSDTTPNPSGRMCPEDTLNSNHIGPLFLTELLKPELRKTSEFYGTGRVVMLSSIAAQLLHSSEQVESWLEAADAAGETSTRNKNPIAPLVGPLRSFADSFKWYGLSKFGNLAQAEALVSEGIEAVAVHPGFIFSGFGKNFPGISKLPPNIQFNLLKLLRIGSFIVCKTPLEGSYTSVFCVVEPNLRPGGRYADCRDKTFTNEFTTIKPDSNAAKLIHQWALKHIETL